MRNTLSLLALALSAALTPLCASADSDQDRARSALLAGEILPLPAILERVAKEHPGNVLEVELDREGERWIYELKILQGGGGLLKLKVDARDGKIISNSVKPPPSGERGRERGRQAAHGVGILGRMCA